MDRARFTALLVTHDVQEAMALGDRVVLIEEGQDPVRWMRRSHLPVRARAAVHHLAALEDRVLQRVLKGDVNGGGRGV